MSMLEQGRRIDAVRMYREQTGAGQREAALAVEALGRAASAPATRTYASPASRDANLKADLWALIQNGQTIEAIQFYRRRTGESINRAKDAVEALAREHGVVPARVGCFGLIVLCLAFPTILVFLVAS
jgi:ribosomal protein L7/L12